MAAKFGFSAYHSKTDEALITELLEILQLLETDMTIFYGWLAMLSCSSWPKASMQRPDDIAFLVQPTARR